MNTHKWLTFFALGAVLVSCSSDDDNPEPVNEEEVITTLTVTLTPQGGTPVILESKDLDGDGPNDPVITVSGNLAANTTYNGTIVLLNETETPAEDITEEVEEEAEEHQFFYEIRDNLDATVAYDDTEADYPPNTGTNPVGLSFILTAGNASTGSFRVTLKHEPNKDATGVADGDITNAGGETDIDQTFNLTIE
ncbi:type 1 periplasmic binding fold superfamily protein [Abyssalbus ytuae]|uniref:Type 1 periplasmic binding fold superfamily protein n=1 Tax=Abyssalbus ytuae TaxID=2926907 RepID=A0A9E7CZE3_9FLAO|nr:type 1 periplasmic binding fold superfamily protein [Abyssalbus ytuae]UOB17470.1 type 1 periplasmic binding fold superfamily protein [Abyssalbus ytuae]